MADLTTSPAGIWVLQALLGVETMPIALRLRPFIPSIDSGPTVATMVGERPLTQTAEYASLVAAGVIDPDGRVDDAVRDWMAVVGRPEREVVVVIRRPVPDSDGAVQERTLSVCRRGRWLAMIARNGDELVLGAGRRDRGGRSADRADLRRGAARVRRRRAGRDRRRECADEGAAVRSDGDAGQDRWAVGTALARLGLSPDQVAVVVAGTRMDESAMAVVTVVDHGATRYVHPAVLTVIDTEHGRVSVTYTTGPTGRAGPASGPPPRARCART